jgi:hypothetical protein
MTYFASATKRPCFSGRAVCLCIYAITWDAHAVCAQVTKAQDATSICDHNDLNIVAGPILHDLIEAALVPEG